MKVRLSLALALALLGGCNPGDAKLSKDALPLEPAALRDAGHPTGSSPIVTSVARGAVYSVNPDSGTITRLIPSTGDTTEIDVGAEPSRITTAGDQIFVTLRGERGVVRIDATRFEEGVQARWDGGAEPVGIVAREDGQRIYVALSQSNSVFELDATELTPIRDFDIPSEPRYLALHPSGGSLFVGSGRGEALLSRISLRTGETTEIELPSALRFGVDGEIALVPRLTGDLWVTPAGDKLLVPALYTDTTTPVADVLVEPGQEVPVVPPFEEGYGGGAGGVDKFTPSVVEVPVGVEGEPAGEPRALFVSTTVFTDDALFNTSIGSYISSVAASPDGEHYLVTMQGSKAALLLDPNEIVFGSDINIAEPSDGDVSFGLFTPPEEAGFEIPALAVMVAGEGSDGAVFLGSSAYVHNGFDDQVGALEIDDARSILAGHIESRANFGDFASAGATWVTTTSPLPADVRTGRSLFYSATNRSMGAGGISCSTCHFEGRNDGMTFTFESGLRQTPSLAGVVSETAPVTWSSGVESVAREAELTTIGRMGGEGLDPAQLDAVAAYVDWTRLPDTANQGPQSRAEQRGQALFERPDVACSSCHSGDRYTDNRSYDMAGLSNVNTPSLSGIAASAPYLHNGSFETLRGVLEWSRSGAMGDTSSLSDAEMDDLEAYLLSL